LSLQAVPPREEIYYQNRLADTGIIHKRIPCDDVEGYDMLGEHWEECREFLQSVKNTPDGRVVVHCLAGVNRSGFVVCGAYMFFQRHNLIPAVRHCLVRRGRILWNQSFQDQLCLLAHRENLLGPRPKSYTDDRMIDESTSLPAHEVLGISETQWGDDGLS